MQQAGDEAAALGLDDPLQCIGIAGEEIARRTGGDRLLHQIQQALAWFLLADRQLIEQLQQEAGIEQVKRREGTEQRLAPVTAGKPAVVEGEGLAGQQTLAEFSPLLLIIGLKAVQGAAWQIEPGVAVLPGEPRIGGDPQA
ncbi:hypothetical protein D3C86_1490190 [compost metagenome]